ncbi:MAG: DUF1294 domain-containing protein [Candidatus Moranbacteria bacterium]|nr:DUF1294 domain-containing protein [Candidatus Moranbacteria bacterium]
MDTVSPYTIVFFTVVNVLAFLFMVWDKTQSRKSGAERIPEGLLFFMATMFGSIGVYLGMLLLRHKTRRWYFMIGIPMLILQNGATLWVIQRVAAGGLIY